MTYEELELLTKQWAVDKGIMVKSNAFKQFEKTLEELEELAVELTLFEVDSDEADIDNLKGELGDVIVTLILMASFFEIDLPECLEQAYTKISKRKGKMISGHFVKAEDLPKD